MSQPYVSIHGNRLGLSGDGILRVDGRDFKGAVPTLGKDIFVDSVTGNDNSDGLVPDRALATLDAAFAKCTADKGYVIYVLPKHSETITGAGGITHDVAGVSVIGLGQGGQRPTFLMDAGTAVTYLITGNDAYVSNIVLNSGHADVATAINIQTATGVTIDGVEFGDNTTDENFVNCVQSGTTTDNQCDDLTLINNIWQSIDAGCISFYVGLGDVTGLLVSNNLVNHAGTGAASLVQMTSGDDARQVAIDHNRFMCLDAAGGVGIFFTDTAVNTGFVNDNFQALKDVADELVASGSSGLFFYENRTASVADKTGYVLPAVDS
jgi:hypothetical protein